MTAPTLRSAAPAPPEAAPLADGEESAKELERAMKTYGLKGAQILTNIAGEKEISDPGLEPFWKKAEELNALVAIHPTNPLRLSRAHRIPAEFDAVAVHHLEDAVGAEHEDVALLQIQRLLVVGVDDLGRGLGLGVVGPGHRRRRPTVAFAANNGHSKRTNWLVLHR